MPFAPSADRRLPSLTEFLAADALAAGRLVRPFDRVVRNEKAYYIVHAPGAGGSRKIRLAKEWLLEEALLSCQHTPAFSHFSQLR